jgi:hypothetical protein
VNVSVPLALFSWPLVAVYLCATLRPRRAVIAAYIAAWLFLPVYSYDIPGMPDWTKTSATSISLLVGLLMFDAHRIVSFRPQWIDLPMFLWCLLPYPSSIANELGFYDGFSTSLNQIVTWGLPYLLGRIYLGGQDGLRDLAVGIFIGGLAYVPFCAYELRMSPQLHGIVYGFYQHQFGQTMRFGGWRPTVFMDHGLMVAMWMSMACLAGIWLYLSGSLRSLRGIALPWFFVPLMVTALLCKSMGALFLLAVGLLLMAIVRRYPSPVPLVLLAVVVPLYILVRSTGLWSGAELLDAASIVSAERAASLKTRLDNEDILSEQALRRPLFGWGGWGRGRVSDESGKDISVTDGLWILEFGFRGFSGVAAMVAVFLLPVIMLVRRIPAWEWSHARASPAAMLGVVVALYLMDCVSNAMITPVFVLAIGALTGLRRYAPPPPARPNPVPVPTGS